MENRNVIVHVHIFKNAGSSFDDTLLANFKGNFIDHREDYLIRKDKDFLENYLKENDKVKAFSSHSIYHKPDDFDDVKLHPVYFLRHPIERIKSVYSFEKKQPAEDSSGAMMAKKLNFHEYLTWRMQDAVPATIRNLQTIFLAGNGPHPRHMDKKFELAFENLNTSPLVGIVDRYDESMVVFEEYLKSFFPNIDLSYIRQNITDPDLQSSVEEKTRRLLFQLREPLQELVKKNNEFDLALYEKANFLLDKKIEDIENFEKKLNDFQARCKLKQLQLLFDQNKYKKVLESSEEIIKQKIKNVKIHLLYAESLQKLKLYEKALSVYEDIILKYPNNPWAYFHKSAIYMLSGDEAESKKLFALYTKKFKDKVYVISYFQKLYKL